jgi:hypothetical protein
MQIDPAIALLLRAAGAALFASAALHKLRGFAYFRVALADYRLVPWWASGLAARSVVAAELSTAALLASPLARPIGFAAAAGLLAVYSLAIAVNLLRGRSQIDCGCFGPAHRAPLGPALLARNAVLGALALLGLAPIAARPLVALDALTAAGGVALLGLVYASANRLLENAPHLRALRGGS